MKVVIAGGSGHVGAVLIRHFLHLGDEVVILSRKESMQPKLMVVLWDGKTLGSWEEELEGADVVINLTGRSVNCRYNIDNLNEMMASRVDSVRVLGQAITACTHPPKVWLQASTATIYAHRYDAPNDEITGLIGGHEPGAPFTWNVSIDIAKAWEAELAQAVTPNTRKVAMRSAMTMSADPGSVFFVFASLARKFLGGRLGDGKQFVSWIHELDFARAVSFLIEHEDISGAVNICSPNPLPQAEFARIIRESVKVPFGIPAPAIMVELGTRLMKTESELVLKSRRVVPSILLQNGFKFDFPKWEKAAACLAAQLN
jgi:uncharacterized protein (TIGR01777 family)